MDCHQVIFSGHAVQRMFARNISRAQVLDVLQNGEIIGEYPDDQPFPSRLLLGFVAGRPVHVVVGFDQNAQICYVITAYDPDPNLWNDDFRQRRQP